MQRMLRRKCLRRVVDHILSFSANGQNAHCTFFDGHHGRFVDDDALSGDGDKGIGGSEVDRHIV